VKDVKEQDMLSINKLSKSQQCQAAVEKGKQQTLVYKQELTWEPRDALPLLSFWECHSHVCSRKPGVWLWRSQGQTTKVV